MKHQIKKAVIFIFLVMIAVLIGCRRIEDKVEDDSPKKQQQAEVPWSPRPLRDIKFEASAERLQRGQYLVEGVCHCFQCHTQGETKEPGSQFYLHQPVKGREGAGAIWGTDPYVLVVPNITPDRKTGIGAWSDDAIARAIREGVSQDGKALSGEMPSKYYRALSDEDLASIIVYLRSIPAIKNRLPRTQLPPELYAELKPEPITSPVPPPDFADPVKVGAYLTSLGRCAECHGEKFAGMGGFEQVDGLASANLTPAPSTNLYYEFPAFVEAMHLGKVGARKFNAPMPWWYFGHMNEGDLHAIYTFLHTLEPVTHRIDNTEPPTDCPLCGTRHGFGDRNYVDEASTDQINPRAYDNLTGRYRDETNPDSVVVLSKDGDGLLVEMDGEKEALLPASENEFFVKTRFAQLIFQRNRRGKPTQLILRKFNHFDRVLTRMES